MIMIRELFCRLTGYRYAYRVEFKYRNSINTPIQSVTLTALLTSPRYLDDFRLVKKELAWALIKQLSKHQLCNGHIVIEPKFFMGFYRPSKKTMAYEERFKCDT